MTSGARRAVGTHYGPTQSDTLGRLQPMPSEGRQRWHYDTLSSPHQLPHPFTISDDYGPPGAVARGMGTATASAAAGAAGLGTFQGRRAGRTSGRTKPD
jgi:hypothetical protein